MEQKRQEGITAGKHENFSEWYVQAVQKAELVDYGPVKGTTVFMPYSYSMWENIKEVFDKRIKLLGHKNAYFPLPIPESFLKKESEHFKGFTPEVYWVTHSGDSKLGERLAVRPTSETIIYHFFSKWIRSWRDLPLLLNQWCSVVRAEIKSTKPFIRTSEFLWQEGHTAHGTKEDADEEMMSILEEYRNVIENYLAVPVLVGTKSDSEKFAGALTTTTLEAMMPDGRALQMGTSHNLGQNFSKPFEIKFLDKDEKYQHAWTTSWGISTRLLGGLIMVHGDDKGLIMPPKVAHTHAAIVPIYYKPQDKKKVMAKAGKVKTELEKNGIRYVLDDREGYTPGWKFNEWEMKGVPLRIEIGPKDVAKKQFVLVRRDNFQKVPVKEKDLVKKTKSMLADLQKGLYTKAKKLLNESIIETKSYDDFKKAVSGKGGFIKASWCGDQHCENQVKMETTATIRVIPFEKHKAGKCIYCSKAGKHVVYFAKSY